MAAKYGGDKPKADIQAQAQIPAADTETGRSVDALMERLNLLRH
jgi:ATP-dependent Clp protease protease subunit